GGSDQVGAGMVAFGERSHFTGTANGAGEPGRLEVGTAQGTKNVRSQPAKPDGEHGAGQDVGKVDTDEPDHVRGEVQPQRGADHPLAPIAKEPVRDARAPPHFGNGRGQQDRKSTRLNSSHVKNSYAV